MILEQLQQLALTIHGQFKNVKYILASVCACSWIYNGIHTDEMDCPPTWIFQEGVDGETTVYVIWSGLKVVSTKIVHSPGMCIVRLTPET